MKFNTLICLVVLFALLVNCSKDNNREGSNLENTDSTEVFSSEFTAQIIEQGGNIIDDEIELAFSENSNVALDQIKTKIENLEGVKSALVSEKGTSIMVNEKNGAVLNLLIFSKSDERFIASETISSKSSSATNKRPPVVANSSTSIGKALILAPHQSEFKESLGSIRDRFAEANYATDIYINEQADLDKFRSSFLQQYDIVYISTHGLDEASVNGTNQLGISSSLSTGQASSENYWLGLPASERTATTNFDDTFGITPRWFEITANSTFSNTWVFINACHSATFDSGNRSFSQAFFNLGAAAYNGFTDFIYVSLGSAIGDKAVVTFTSGKSFTEMDESVRDDVGLRALSIKLRLAPNSVQQYGAIDLFTSRKNIADPFYLVLPENLVGSASINPDSGPVDTPAIYTVVINSNYINLVDNITFEIDNTNQSGLVMTKINETTWEYTNLTAPDGNYPRIDTFAFTAFDAENNVLGKGSAAFSFTTTPTGKPVKNSKQTWLNKK